MRKVLSYEKRRKNEKKIHKRNFANQETLLRMRNGIIVDVLTGCKLKVYYGISDDQFVYQRCSF